MSERRQACLPLPQGFGQEQLQPLLERLRQLPGMDRANIDNNSIVVDYRFPELCRSRVWQELGTDRRRLPLPTRLHQGLRALLEDNERERALAVNGWHARIEAIYADCHRQRKLPPSARRLWEGYDKRKTERPQRRDKP